MTFQLRKCIFDLALSIPAFFFLSFFMLVIALLVRLRIGSPFIFADTAETFADAVSEVTKEVTKGSGIYYLLLLGHLGGQAESAD